METGENLLMLHLSFADMRALVSDMRRMGYNVECMPKGYVCHEQTRYGKTLVIYAKQIAGEYRVKVNPAFFDVGQPKSEALH